uniref:DNA-directed DNA polymerase n=1 Tax=Tanacetum cinerariifolium TaxID=118510 RepID=A0A6L2MSD7_TANCI|nr:DNA polymerase-like [Tanacetum cinerariifolium]
MRNNRLYELSVYSGKVMLFRFRVSLNLLPGTLQNLAMSLCPNLRTKGSIDHESVNEKSLKKDKDVLIEYMKTDILLLGEVMQKAQNIYWKLYQLDIESKIILSSLAVNIFRLRYYNDEIFPIHIPNQNEDTFIRKAYYGCHTDSYKPYGKNLYYYDVNSLYPFVMKEYHMPCGKHVWYSNLEDMDIDSMLGVYYSEELKYAIGLGYKVVPISGYIFKRKESPFKDFVSSLFSSRLEARKKGNDALSYVYKILMNSLYSRFEIDPKSIIIEVYNFKRKHSKKYKGPAKDKVTPEWFKKQYAEPSRRVQVKVDVKFMIDWESLEIKNQEIIFSLDDISRKVISLLSGRVLHLENKRLNEKLEERNREIAKLKSKIEVQTGVTNQTLVKKKTDMKTKTDEEKQKIDEEKLNTDGVLALGVALMMGRLVVLWPFCGLSSRLSAIAVEIGKLQNLIQESRRVLNLFLKSVKTLDPDLKEARIRATRERIKDLEGRQQALRAEQEDLIVRAVTRRGHQGD